MNPSPPSPKRYPPQPKTSRPPDISPEDWQRYVLLVISSARRSPKCATVPDNAIDRMREMLLGGAQ